MKNQRWMLLGILSLLLSAAGGAWAAEDSDIVTVTVNYVDLLEVPETAALTLTTSTAGATAYDQATLTQTDLFKYSHNSTSGKQITATALADVGNPANDITLTAAIEGGAGAVAVVSSGVDQADVVLWTGITADGYTLDLSWTADGSLSGTTAGANANQDYVWTVTFTSSDA